MHRISILGRIMKLIIGMIIIVYQTALAQAPLTHAEIWASSEVSKLYVVHGTLDSTWKSAPGENQSFRKYRLLNEEVGPYRADAVLVEYGTLTLVGEAPEDAILIVTQMDYNEFGNIILCKLIAGDASIGLLKYEDGLWERLTQMTQDELLAYCAPANTISFDEAVNMAVEFVKNKYPNAISVTYDSTDTSETSRYTLYWLLGVRAEFDPNDSPGPDEHLVAVNDRGIVVYYTYVGF